ncbi:hypothetical protein [Rossellomorea marisflavi]|uniref:Uncharacterized protein n=1 Tax=Rossellomorea marisflavi TaxID=189381 RepID=A0A165ISY2_9BACI|nr:hypothetical protein [Rossellomorea marisflavi]KMK95663.1 hypothetical protein VL03_05570 [Rossellomorea marisflavi]KZE44232.1 hypothetical protein AV649_07990 [Rossellomorea marisflavi]
MNMQKSKKEKLPVFYLEHMHFPTENRQYIIVCLLIFMDFLGILPLLSDPFHKGFFWAGAIPVIAMNIWGLLYIFAPYKFERSYYLYMGVFGLITAYLYFIVAQKFMYVHVGVEGPLIGVIGLVLFVAVIVFFQIFNHRMLYSGKYDKLDEDSSGFNLSPILAASSMGYIVAQFLMSLAVTDSFMIMVMVASYSVLILVMAYFATYLHRYIYILKHPEQLKSMYSGFGLPKKERKY